MGFLSYVQTDTTYAHSIEKYVRKVCAVAHEIVEGDQNRELKASILQCLSAMVMFSCALPSLSCLVLLFPISLCCLVVVCSNW